MGQYEVGMLFAFAMGFFTASVWVFILLSIERFKK